jgi:hypothetical protein
MPGSYGGRNLLVCQVLSPLSLAFQKGGLQVRVSWGVRSGCSGPFGPLTPMDPVLGFHGQLLFFPRLTLALEFAILSAVCGADVEGSNVEGLAGGSCLSHLWQAAGSVQSPASLPHIHQVEGINQVSSPVRGGIPQ